MDVLQIDVLESLAHYVHIVSHKYGASKHEAETMIRAAEMILGFYQRDEERSAEEHSCKESSESLQVPDHENAVLLPLIRKKEKQD